MPSALLIGRFGRGMPAFVAAVFLLSCLATVAHLAMGEGEGCQAAEPSFRGCGPRTSHEPVPTLPALAAPLEPSPVPTAWLVPALHLMAASQHHAAPPVPRSPPSVLP